MNLRNRLRALERRAQPDDLAELRRRPVEELSLDELELLIAEDERLDPEGARIIRERVEAMSDDELLEDL